MASAEDDAYNTRLWSPGYEATLATLTARGEAVRADPAMRRDLVWGPGANRLVDLLPPYPAGDSLVIFVHGGYWQYRGAGRNAGHFLAPAYLELGWGFAALTYELCPHVDMDGMTAQIGDAVAWLAREGGAALGRPVRRMFLIGHSAGAHLVAMAALRPPRALAELDCAITGACGVSGLYDLRPLVSTYLNAALRMDEDCAWRNSPARVVDAGAPPFLLAFGAKESPAFAAQTADFAASCRAAGNAVETYALPGRDHYAAIEDLAEPATPLARGIEAILRQDARRI